MDLFSRPTTTTEGASGPIRPVDKPDRCFSSNNSLYGDKVYTVAIDPTWLFYSRFYLLAGVPAKRHLWYMGSHRHGTGQWLVCFFYFIFWVLEGGRRGEGTLERHNQTLPISRGS